MAGVIFSQEHGVFSWLKILLFGGSTIVSPSPTAIAEVPLEIAFEKPIVAYNNWATFHVNVSEYSSEARSEEVLGFVKGIGERFPADCVLISLESAEGDLVTFSNKGVGWNNPKDVWVIATADGNLPSKKYTSMKISSCEPLSHASITWFNYGKH